MLFLQILCPIYILFIAYMAVTKLRSGSRYIKHLQAQGKRVSRLHNFEFTGGIVFLLGAIAFVLIFIGISWPTNPQALSPVNMPLMGLVGCLASILCIFMGVQLPYLTYLALYKQSEEVGGDAKKWEKAPLSVYVMIGAGLSMMGLALVWIGIFSALFTDQIGANAGLFAGVALALIGVALILFITSFIHYLRSKARDAQRKFAGEREEKQRPPA
jgi:hypothetical protein